MASLGSYQITVTVNTNDRVFTYDPPLTVPLTYTSGSSSGVWNDFPLRFNRTLPLEGKIEFPFLQDLLEVCSDEELQELSENLADILNKWAETKGLILSSCAQ